MSKSLEVSTVDTIFKFEMSKSLLNNFLYSYTLKRKYNLNIKKMKFIISNDNTKDNYTVQDFFIYLKDNNFVNNRKFLFSISTYWNVE